MRNRMFVGAKVRIKDSNSSALEVGSTHTVTEKEDFKEQGETVWGIKDWLFRRSHLQLLKD